MNNYVKFMFEHKKDRDQFQEAWTINELIYGVGETKQPVKELIEAYEEDGYKIIDVVMEEEL